MFSISACGQAAEEFWCSNVLSTDTKAFGDENVLSGHSPFRELQLLIDSQLAGVAWPFPVVFTGGVVHGFWRPIVGIDAFDLLEDEVDITPFLLILTNDQDHTFETRVVAIEDDGQGHGELAQSIESNWVVTGKPFVWLDTKSSLTIGTEPTIHDPKSSIKVFSKIDKHINGATSSLEYCFRLSRLTHISSTLRTSKGLEDVAWTQNLACSSYGEPTTKGNNQNVRQ